MIDGCFKWVCLFIYFGRIKHIQFGAHISPLVNCVVLKWICQRRSLENPTNKPLRNYDWQRLPTNFDRKPSIRYKVHREEVSGNNVRGSITTYTLSVLLWLLSQSDPIPLARLWLPEQQLSICSFIFAWMLQRVMKQKMNGHSWGCAKCNWHGHIIFEKQKLNRGPAMKKQGLTPIECSESVVFVCKESVVCKVANSKQVSSGN